MLFHASFFVALLLSDARYMIPPDILGVGAKPLKTSLRHSIFTSDISQFGISYDFSQHPLLISKSLDLITVETRLQRLPLFIDYEDVNSDFIAKPKCNLELF